MVPMTPEQIALVAGTWADLEPRRQELGDRFYAHLFEHHPEVRPMFPTDLAELQAKFTAEIGALVAVVTDLGSFLARTAELGETHAGYGVRAGHYRASRASLLEAIGALVADGDRAGALVAWAAVHDLVAETMMGAGTSARS